MEFIPQINPLGNIWLSAFVALLPIICFFLCLIVFKTKAYTAGFLTVIVATLVALFVYKMPFIGAITSIFLGFLTGLWPIAWIIIAAIFLYKLSIKSGQFEIIKQSVMLITPDHRIQVILIGFCFGAFLEGAIGFGGPVAITAALLVGLGLRPLQAAGYCMIANTAPVAFGAVGIPIIAMAQSVGLSPDQIAAMVGKILTPLCFIVPFFIIYLMDGIKGIKETFPIIFVAAASFTIAQYLTSNFIGAELPGIISAVFSLICTTIAISMFKIKNIVRYDGKTDFNDIEKLKLGKIIYAWSPFILLIIFVVIWSNHSFQVFVKENLAFTNLKISFSALTGDLQIFKPSLVVEGQKSGVQALFMSIPLISTAGTAIFFAAICSIFVLKVKPSDAVSCFSATIKEMALPCLTIGLVVAFAYITNYSGASSTLGLAFSQTGKAFTFFSPIIGWIGVFLTGSDTSANLLFGALQQATAIKLQMQDTLFLAANSTGGVVGKMISPQSIAVACAAVGLVGKESDLFKFTIKYSIIMIILIGLWISFIAYFMPAIIPDSVAVKIS
ncbi:L-lactate permease [Campylobacter canadensis]|uniref:L-lactate permease n=1 Tax=Campylobacter canadensis TaxID=449520 RepID=A0ABS7WRY7_9BACT|nr:lactate permease LctP family transporter [Campylobacter canadensis]MBZ7987520.1 lactate permease LctP family transporter [Campylobacter canadensis]MBZ7994863.1 lactate permease LctP family transporter [Campylobacter canadensis]MBZ7996353.1 lactate permease LctP family transporter [Campylobacter canadensis]MBZ7998386.1 lactate permease LctP family transporter [Campylobacter canadensis]MBZ8000101.1 lactate permease LctP family transporter [Campylobacter canadensis]